MWNIGVVCAKFFTCKKTKKIKRDNTKYNNNLQIEKNK